MACGCCSDKADGEVFVPRSKRWCTDVFCLLLLVACSGGLAAIAYLGISAHPDLIWDLVYPTDSFGNNCGKPGTSTEELPKVFYPDLDQDIITHGGYLASQQYLTFLEKITRVCATDCPQGVSLSAPTVYGGYEANNGTTVPTYTYTFTTQNVASRCFPLSSTFAGVAATLCVQPNCLDEDLNATLGGTLECKVLPDRPDETTTWEVCPTGTSAEVCALQTASCEYSVKQGQAFTYLPPDATASSQVATEELADKVQLLIGACAAEWEKRPGAVVYPPTGAAHRMREPPTARYDAVLVANVEVVVFGTVLPVLLGFGWTIILWFFAAAIIYTMIGVLFILLILIDVWLCAKSGWFGDVQLTGQVSGFLDSIGVESGSGESSVLSFNSSLLAQASADESAWYQAAAWPR